MNAPSPPTTRERRGTWPAAGWHVLAAAAFTLLATLNTAGYRYGVGDQAFYVPSILRQLDGRLFPRDSALLDGQSRLFVFDELLARATGVIPASLETWFLGLYLLTLALLYAGLVRIADRLLVSRWSIAAFLAVATIRHRIAKTAANTLEGYFHPRQLAFAIGLLGLGEVLRGRPGWALVAAAVAGAIHPTTGIWFVGWIGVALVVEQPRLRPALGIGAAIGLAAGLGLLAAGFLPVQRMDDAWLSTLAGKDYLFATDWGVVPWVLNGAYPVVIVATFLARRRRGLTQPGELGLVAGCLALIAVFAATLPLVAAHVAVAVQLQISRVFWMADVVAMLGIVWWLAEARPAAASREAARAATRPRWAFAAAAAFALGRGSYAMLVEHPERAAVRIVGPRRRMDRRLELSAPGYGGRHPRPRRPQPRLALRDVAPRARRPRRVPGERQGRGDEHVRSEDGAARRGTAPRPRRLRGAYRRRAAGARPALRSAGRRVGARAGAAGALPQPAVQGLSPHAVTTSTAPPPTTPREAFAPAAYVAHPRWTGGHWMTIYTWARRRRFARLPEPEARVFDVAPDARVLAHSTGSRRGARRRRCWRCTASKARARRTTWSASPTRRSRGASTSCG